MKLYKDKYEWTLFLGEHVCWSYEPRRKPCEWSHLTINFFFINFQIGW